MRRSSQDSRGPTPTQENGLADSTNPTPTDSHSSISVVTHTGGRYGDGQSASRMRCRDYDGMSIFFSIYSVFLCCEWDMLMSSDLF